MLKILPGVERVLQPLYQLLRLVPDTPVQVHQVGIEVVEHLKGRRLLVEQHPAAPTEHLDIPLHPHRKPRQNAIA